VIAHRSLREFLTRTQDNVSKPFYFSKNSLHYKNVSRFAADFMLYFSLFSLTMINFQEEDTNHVHELINTPISFEERWL